MNSLNGTMDCLRGALIVYLLIGFLFALAGFIIMLFEGESSRLMRRAGCITAPLIFIKVMLTWPVVAQDIYHIHKLRKHFRELVRRMEKDLDDDEKH